MNQFAVRAAIWISGCVLAANIVHIPLAPGQESSPPAVSRTLRDDDALGSGLQALRSDLIAAITGGVDDVTLARLLSRSAVVDDAITQQSETIDARWRDESKKLRDATRRDAMAAMARRRAELGLARVELSLLQSDLFTPGSADAVAIAAQTVDIAARVLGQLPAESLVRGEVLRLAAEAELRRGNPDAATQTLRLLITDSATNGDADAPEPGQLDRRQTENDPRLVALRIQIAIVRGDRASASRAIAAADRVFAADPSPAIDFAKLEFLLLAPDQAALADWVAEIRARHGPAAGTRAETMLARQRDRWSDETPADVRLTIADAKYLARIGRPLDAALAFARAAVSDARADRACQSSIAAASILKSIDRGPAAAELLATMAVRHAAESPAAAMMSLAAGLTDADDTAMRQSRLRSLLETWPQSDAARAARDAWIDSLDRSGDALAAARLASELPESHWDESAFTRAERLWCDGLSSTNSGGNPDEGDFAAILEATLQTAAERLQRDIADVEPLLAAFASATTSADETESRTRAREAFQRCCILVAPIGHPAIRWDQMTCQDAGLESLRRFRIDPTSTPDPAVLRQSDADQRHRVAAMIDRLQKDVRMDPSRRKPVADFLLAAADSGAEWSASTRPLAHMRWQFWAGQNDVARAALDRQIRRDGGSSAIALAVAADALSASTNPADQLAAANGWRQVASGLPQGSPPWHMAQIAAIQARRAGGERREATADAGRVLLTHSPDDARWLARLQQLAEQP